MATTPELQRAKTGFEKAYTQTVDSAGRLEGDLDQIVTICDRARTTNNSRAQAAIWNVVESEAGQSQKLWERWSDGLRRRLPPLAAAIGHAQGGLTPTSKADLFDAQAALVETIKLHLHQAGEAVSAGASLEAHRCGPAKAETRSLASSEDLALGFYHQARGLIAEALQRG